VSRGDLPVMTGGSEPRLGGPSTAVPAVGRLAPTPSGQLHLGNALAFGAAWLSARAAGGRLLLRIEDLDRGRARADVADAQRRDLEWLGLHWDAELAPQSERRYSVEGLPCYRCDCPRRRRLEGLCAHRRRPASTGAIRLRCPEKAEVFEDRAAGPQRFVPEGDPILVRPDGEAAYPLAVVLDDLRDGVTEVVRGADLLEPTAVQLVIYRALGRAPPSWLHVPVLLGPDGRKLSKSHGSTELGALRASGWTPARVWRTLGPLLGLPAEAGLDPRLFEARRVQGGPRIVSEDGTIAPPPAA
jgi:glutamyl-Q tRNA(Asp) synthetase